MEESRKYCPLSLVRIQNAGSDLLFLRGVPEEGEHETMSHRKSGMSATPGRPLTVHHGGDHLHVSLDGQEGKHGPKPVLDASLIVGYLEEDAANQHPLYTVPRPLGSATTIPVEHGERELVH